jgi:gamma-glutamyltranspeptidase/glutathione hydrolase
MPDLPPQSIEAVRWMAAAQAEITDAREEVPDEFLAAQAVALRKQALDAATAGLISKGSTTHISVIDSDGMAVGITHSNGEGCGYVVPGTGAMMNNFLGEDDINPHGFHSQPAGERMLTMMCPTIVRKDNQTWVLGTGGSNRIRTSVMQVVHNLVALGMSAREAVRAPRIHVEGEAFNLETIGQDPATVRALSEEEPGLVLFNDSNMFFGGVHVAALGPDGFDGIGDIRRGGVLCLI